MSTKIHFRSKFFAKEEFRQKEDWMNEHFVKGYVVAELEEIESGYFVQLVHDPHAGMLTRIRFFQQGAEEHMDHWIESKFADGWNFDVHATQLGYWVIIYRQVQRQEPPAWQLILNQFIGLWWLWLIGTLVFGFLYFTSQ